MGPGGLEPPTYRLKVGSSAIELWTLFLPAASGLFLAFHVGLLSVGAIYIYIWKWWGPESNRLSTKAAVLQTVGLTDAQPHHGIW